MTLDRDEALTVSGLTTDQIGTAAGAAGITLLELTAQQASLEEAFMDLTRRRGRVPRDDRWSDVMTTITLPAYTGEQRVSQLRVLHSEWTKLRSLPSTIWSPAGRRRPDRRVRCRATRWCASPARRPTRRTFDAVAVSLAGVQLAQLAIGVLGVLLITGEYATGSIRVSLAAVPGRLQLLWGKAVTFGLTALVLCVPAVLAAFLVGQSILSAENLDIGLGEPGVVRAVLGSALFLTAVGLLGLGLGALLRNTAGGIAALFGLLFAPQILVGFLPESVADTSTSTCPRRPARPSLFVTPDPTVAAARGSASECSACTPRSCSGLAAWQLRRRDA